MDESVRKLSVQRMDGRSLAQVLRAHIAFADRRRGGRSMSDGDKKGEIVFLLARGGGGDEGGGIPG